MHGIGLCCQAIIIETQKKVVKFTNYVLLIRKYLLKILLLYRYCLTCI